VRVVVAIVVWIAAIAAAAGVSTAVSNSIHPTIDATSVTAPQRQSMFQGDNFVKAWATIKSHLGANITTEQVVVYPGYVNVQAERGNSGVFAVLYVGGKWREDNGGDATPQFGTFPLSQVDPNEPRALVRQLATYNHVPASELRYMIAKPDPISKQLEWLIFTNGNSNPFTYSPSTGSAKGGASGSNGSSSASAPTPSSSTHAGSVQPGASQLNKQLQLATCVAAAGTDVTKIQACQAKYGG